MEQVPRAGNDEFAEQFTSVLYENWSEILQVINRQSPRIAVLLRVAAPSGLKRINGGWHIQVMTRRVVQRDKFREPRANQILGQAVLESGRTPAATEMRRVTVNFRLEHP